MTNQNNAAQELPDFNSPEVQAVYETLCGTAWPPAGEHWEGWVSRHIVLALSKLRAEGVQAGDERAALAWYAEQVAGCRKFGADGDAARQALDKDGGRRARAALASTPVAGKRCESFDAWLSALNLCKGSDLSRFSLERNGSYVSLPDLLREAWASATATATVAGEAQESIEQMAVNRYRPVPDGKFSYKVVAGDGSRSLYTGAKDSCLRVAAKLTEAFLDGAFVASDAAPQASEK